MSDSAKTAKPRPVHARVIKEMQPVQKPVQKAETSTQIEIQEAFNGSEWIQQPMDLHVLERYVSESSILPQCIHSYRNNIPGFGIGVRYIEDVEETPDMVDEFNKAEEIIELLTIEQDTKEIFEDIIEARETYGIAYVEVIRNLANEVVQIEFIRNTPSIMKTEPLEPYVPFTYYHHGTSLVRQRKFRKYRQDIGGKTVYYKEFGDPRIMDRRNGKYLEAGEALDRKWQANEILEFAIGTKPYGEVRWIGQLLGVDGSRRAESLNNNYFINGRHTPLLIMIKGGTLTEDSYTKLQEYMNGMASRGSTPLLFWKRKMQSSAPILTPATSRKLRSRTLPVFSKKTSCFRNTWKITGRECSQRSYCQICMWATPQTSIVLQRRQRKRSQKSRSSSQSEYLWHG